MTTGVDHQQQHQSIIRELGSLILQTLDGFVFALHRDGKIMYISETASVHLGLPQIDLTGSSIFDYLHPSDVKDVRQILGLGKTDTDELERHNESSANSAECARSFCMRMRCVLPKRNAGLVTSGYKAIHCHGYLKVRRRPTNAHDINLDECEQVVRSNNVTHNTGRGRSRHQKSAAKLPEISSDASVDHVNRQTKFTHVCANGARWDSCALVAVGHSLLPSASTEVKLAEDMFMFRAQLNLSLYYIEPQMLNLLGYESNEVAGVTLYQFVHALDVHHLEYAHRVLLEKGQVMSRYIRLMRKQGGHIWVQWFATIVNNARNMPRMQHIVGLCSVLGSSLDSDVLLETPPATQQAASGQTNLCTSSTTTTAAANATKVCARRTSSDSVSASATKRVRRASRQNHAKSAKRDSKADFCRPTSDAAVSSYVTRVVSASPHQIGPYRRSSDDTCSINSSLASSVSTTTLSCTAYNTAQSQCAAATTTSHIPETTHYINYSDCTTAFYADSDKQQCIGLSGAVAPMPSASQQPDNRNMWNNSGGGSGEDDIDNTCKYFVSHVDAMTTSRNDDKHACHLQQLQHQQLHTRSGYIMQYNIDCKSDRMSDNEMNMWPIQQPTLSQQNAPSPSSQIIAHSFASETTTSREPGHASNIEPESGPHSTAMLDYCSMSRVQTAISEDKLSLSDGSQYRESPPLLSCFVRMNSPTCTSSFYASNCAEYSQGVGRADNINHYQYDQHAQVYNHMTFQEGYQMSSV